jgi:hypothetical protein
MTGTKALKTLLFAGAAVAAASLAMAQEASVSGIDLATSDLSQTSGVEFSLREGGQAPFIPMRADEEQAPRLQLEIAAGGGDSPLDVSFSQRTLLGGGDGAREGGGSEVRIGRGLVDRRGEPSQGSSTYVFVASDREALTWRPGARSEFGGEGASLALQDRVEIGDLAAGVTFERNGVQTSLAYVEREESTKVGNRSFSQDQAFAGVTVTVRN